MVRIGGGKWLKSRKYSRKGCDDIGFETGQIYKDRIGCYVRRRFFCAFYTPGEFEARSEERRVGKEC